MTMNAEEQIQVLRKAGYFQDGDDALSLLAHVDSLHIEIACLQELVQHLQTQLTTKGN
jgi:uncharacterized small protein (DUF1192 family)